jgi:hypothetical protein
MPTRAVIAVLLAMTLAAGSLTPASGARVRIKATANKTWDPAFKAVAQRHQGRVEEPHRRQAFGDGHQR